LIPGTITENLLYGNGAERKALESFRGFLPEWVYSDPDFKVSSDSDAITSGEVRKIALVRAILCSGDMLILDEAFSYMDNTDIESFMSYLPDSLTALIVSRNPVVKQKVDKVYTLSNGILQPISPRLP